MSTDRLKLGARGEEIAEAWLVRRGYLVVERNFRVPSGEIDRIMRDGETLAFVEVKTRRRRSYAAPIEAVTFSKRRRILRAAQCYLLRHGEYETTCRFDVMEIVLADGGPPQITHHPGAFGEE